MDIPNPPSIVFLFQCLPQSLKKPETQPPPLTFYLLYLMRIRAHSHTRT